MASRYAHIMFLGPPQCSPYCEGCDLYEATAENKDNCPVFGDTYRETEEPNRGCLCRAEECILHERTVSAGLATADERFRRWVNSPTRDKIEK